LPVGSRRDAEHVFENGDTPAKLGNLRIACHPATSELVLHVHLPVPATDDEPLAGL
jgi:hypothetical protein